MQLIVMTSTQGIEWDMHIDIRNALTNDDDEVNSYKKGHCRYSGCCQHFHYLAGHLPLSTRKHPQSLLRPQGLCLTQ